jgi:two-component system OmpR family sensor kinase
MSGWLTSLRSRLTMWYALFLGAPLVVFAIVCYVVFEQTLESRTDQFINDALTAFSRELGAERRASLTAIEAMRSTIREVRFRDLHISILDMDGRVLAMTDLPEGDEGDRRPSGQAEQRIIALLRTLDLSREQTREVDSPEGKFRVLARPVLIGREQFSLVGSYSLQDIQEMLKRIRVSFLFSIPLLLGAAATGGYFIAKRGLGPVASMAQHAADISATNLHERLPVVGGAELMGLALVVNDLLDRLEHAFSQQQRFVADASHELRTPTAILRTEADVTLSREHRSESEYRASVKVMQDAVRRLTRIVEDLFLLARSDAGHLPIRRESLYLEDLVHDVTRSVRSVAEQHGVKVALHGVVEAPFEGDADLLGRLLLNLLDNSIKYTPKGGSVDVELGRHENNYEISVADSGPGIPPEAQQRIFERFFRADSARPSMDGTSTSGAGLGLAIARRVAELHSGRLDLVESRPGRTEFRITLPAPPAD